MLREIFSAKGLPSTTFRKHKSGAGFTLVELLVVISITLVILVAAAPLYGNLQVSSQLNDISSQIVQTLRIAREQSVARLNNVEHGLQLEVNRYILYQGPSYVLRDSTYDRVRVLDSALTLSWSLAGAGAGGDVTFSKEFGVPNKTGVITITHEVSGIRSLRINSFGIIEED